MLKALGALIAAGFLLFPPAPEYDLVIRDGRVMDPESGTDDVRHVGISGGRIAAVSVEPLRGRATIDARGLGGWVIAVGPMATGVRTRIVDRCC